MTTQDKPAVGPLSAGDLVQHVVAKNMLRVIRRIDGEWPDVWLNMVGEPHQAHMADRWIFVGRPGPDGWISWSGGVNPVPGQVVDATLGVGSFTNCKSDVVGPFWADSGRFRVAPTAPVEAGRSEREWITGDDLHEIMTTFDERADVSEIAAKINQRIALRPQPSGETLQSLGQAFDDAMEGSHGAWAVSGDEGQPSGETREAVTRVEEFVGAIRGLIRQEGRTLDPADLRTILALLRPVAPDGGGDALADIAAERRRQIEVEGWTPERDDRHDDYSLGLAAASYAGGVDCGSKVVSYTDDVSGGRGDTPIWGTRNKRVPVPWPASWHPRWWKPTGDRRRDLVKAGALIVAEIERLDRSAIPASEGGEG